MWDLFSTHIGSWVKSGRKRSKVPFCTFSCDWFPPTRTRSVRRRACSCHKFQRQPNYKQEPYTTDTQKEQQETTMAKSDQSYSSIPHSEHAPYVQGFNVADSHAVTVIIDEKNGQQSSQFLGGCRKPVQLNVCPRCSQHNVGTKTVTYPSATTWFSVVVGALIFLPICWVPLVVDPLKQTDHFCKNCGAKVGTVKALEGCCVTERS